MFKDKGVKMREYIFSIYCFNCGNKQNIISRTITLKGYCRCLFCNRLINKQKNRIEGIK